MKPRPTFRPAVPVGPTPAERVALGLVNNALAPVRLRAQIRFNPHRRRREIVVPASGGPLVPFDKGSRERGAPCVGGVPVRVLRRQRVRRVPPPSVGGPTLGAAPVGGMLGIAVETFRRDHAKVAGIRGVHPGMVGGRAVIQVTVKEGTTPPALPASYLGWPVVVGVTTA